LALFFFFLTAVSACEAAAAPPLRAVRPFAIGSENTPEVFVPDHYPYNVRKEFSGQHIFLRLKYTGYPNWGLIFVKVDGHIVRWEDVRRAPIQNPAIGYFHTISIPFDEFHREGSSSIAVEVHGRDGSKYTAIVNGVKIKT